MHLQIPSRLERMGYRPTCDAPTSSLLCIDRVGKVHSCYLADVRSCDHNGPRSLLLVSFVYTKTIEISLPVSGRGYVWPLKKHTDKNWLCEHNCYRYYSTV